MEKNPVVLMKTSMGEIKIELFEKQAPISVKNFLNYIESGFYEGTIFHRVIGDFMIQGGGFTADMEKKSTKAPIKNEAHNNLSNDRGTIAMARTSEVDSATAQFFINTVDNPMLNHRGKGVREYGYCVFGKVIEGMDTIDKIRYVETGTNGMHRDVPVEAVTILSVRKD